MFLWNPFTSQGLFYCLGNTSSCPPSHQAQKAYRTIELEDSLFQVVKSFVYCSLLSVRLKIVGFPKKALFRESIINVLTTQRKKETGSAAYDPHIWILDRITQIGSDIELCFLKLMRLSQKLGSDILKEFSFFYCLGS